MAVSEFQKLLNDLKDKMPSSDWRMHFVSQAAAPDWTSSKEYFESMQRRALLAMTQYAILNSKTVLVKNIFKNHNDSLEKFEQIIKEAEFNAQTFYFNDQDRYYIDIVGNKNGINTCMFYDIGIGTSNYSITIITMDKAALSIFDSL